MELYQVAECHECALVRRTLRQNNIPFTAITVPAGDRSLVRKKFGVEGVPILVDGKFVSHNLTDIVRHLEK